MFTFNKTHFAGNLTRDPEVRYSPEGTACATLGVAINHRYKKGEDMKEEVTFIDVIAWGKLGENCGQYLKKGAGVLVSGRLRQRRWETDAGDKRSKIEVVAETVGFLPRREAADGADGGDIPF